MTIRYRKSDRKFLEPNLTHEFLAFVLKMAVALAIGIILAPAIFARAGGGQ